VPWPEEPCDDGNDCTMTNCDPEVGCSTPPVPDMTPCADGYGYCWEGTCILRCYHVNDCAHWGSLCAEPTCNVDTGECGRILDPSFGCQTSNVADGTACGGGTGECEDGACVPLP
jgi:hypothetical protein